MIENLYNNKVFTDFPTFWQDFTSLVTRPRGKIKGGSEIVRIPIGRLAILNKAIGEKINGNLYVRWNNDEKFKRLRIGLIREMALSFFSSGSVKRGDLSQEIKDFIDNKNNSILPKKPNFII